MRLPLHLLFTKLDFFDLNQATANAKAVVATTPYLLAYRPHSSKGLQAWLLLCPEKESSPVLALRVVLQQKRKERATSLRALVGNTLGLLDQVRGLKPIPQSCSIK